MVPEEPASADVAAVDSLGVSEAWLAAGSVVAFDETSSLGEVAEVWGADVLAGGGGVTPVAVTPGTAEPLSGGALPCSQPNSHAPTPTTDPKLAKLLIQAKRMGRVIAHLFPQPAKRVH